MSAKQEKGTVLPLEAQAEILEKLFDQMYISEAEFHDFRAWLISQGRDVYMDALRDPDTLAAVVPDSRCSFPSLSRLGKAAVAHMTGRPFHSGLSWVLMQQAWLVLGFSLLQWHT